MSLVVIGLNHRTSPVELRERFAFAEERIPAALQSLSDSGLAGEAVIVSTCNRVEIYAVTSLEPATAFGELKKFLVRQGGAGGAGAGVAGSGGAGAVGVDRTSTSDAIYTLHEPQSLHHLFKVASGLDSMVLGETEIFGQLKKAYELALQNRRTGAWLNRVFQRAFNVAKHIRTTTNIQRGTISVMSVAVELAEKIFNSLNQHEVLVIGAGETSEKTARALLSRGARSVAVTNRSPERAEILAAELGGRTVPFDQWPEEFDKIDIAISSTSAPGYVLDRARLEPLMKRRKHRPLLLIDIAVPRDIEPGVEALDNVYLYNVDDLQGIAESYQKLRKDEIIHCEKIIEEKVAALLELIRSASKPNQRSGPTDIKS